MATYGKPENRIGGRGIRASQSWEGEVKDRESRHPRVSASYFTDGGAEGCEALSSGRRSLSKLTTKWSLELLIIFNYPGETSL